MGVGPIPRSAIMDYATEIGLLGDAAEQFASVIRRVDVEYLRLSNSTKTDKSDRETTAAVDDVDAMKNVLARMSARAGSASKPQPPKGKQGNGRG